MLRLLFKTFCHTNTFYWPTLDLSPSTCSGNTLGDIAFPHCVVISSFSIICPCHLDVLQILCYLVIPGLSRSSRSSFDISWEPCQCLMWYSYIHKPTIVVLSSWGWWLPLSLFWFSILSPCFWSYLSMWLPLSYVANCGFIFTTVMFHVSAPYLSVDRTSASYNCILVLMLESSKHRICLSNSCNQVAEFFYLLHFSLLFIDCIYFDHGSVENPIPQYIAHLCCSNLNSERHWLETAFLL